MTKIDGRSNHSKWHKVATVYVEVQIINSSSELWEWVPFVDLVEQIRCINRIAWDQLFGLASCSIVRDVLQWGETHGLCHFYVHWLCTQGRTHARAHHVDSPMQIRGVCRYSNYGILIKSHSISFTTLRRPKMSHNKMKERKCHVTSRHRPVTASIDECLAKRRLNWISYTIENAFTSQNAHKQLIHALQDVVHSDKIRTDVCPAANIFHTNFLINMFSNNS